MLQKVKHQVCEEELSSEMFTERGREPRQR